nr:Gag-Pol polyprotein [Tanacetum cinerariifolium]
MRSLQLGFRMMGLRKITALTAENAKLKSESLSKMYSEPIVPEKPKVLAPRMYAISSKYIVPPQRVNRAEPTPLPKKKQATFQEPLRPSNRPTQKTVVQQNKKPNIHVNLSTGVKPATEASKPMIVEPIVEPLELNLCVSSNSKVTMISRFTDYKLSNRKAGSKGIYGCSWHMISDRLKLTNYVDKFIRTVRFRNDQFAVIIGYGDYKLGKTIISRVYYVEGLIHNLFSVRQFCDGGLNVAFRQHTCHICNNDMVDLLQDSNSLHMDLCGPMRIESINKKKYILVIVDDYTRFGWVRFLRTKDETPKVIKKFILTTQRALNATVRYVRTDNGTEFVNKTLIEFFESVGITHNTSVTQSPQQNDIVERRNQTLMEAARTMLIFAKALLFLSAEAIATINTGLEPNTMDPMHNGAGPDMFSLQLGRTRSKLVNDPTTPSVPPSAK